MAYSQWQIRKLRHALNRYRMANAHNGVPRSWRQIRDDILYSHKTLHEFPEDGEGLPAFKTEALRRFALKYKDQVLKQDKLEDVYIFLYDKGYVPDEEWDFDGGNLKEFLAAHDYLANGNPRAEQILNDISRQYAASRIWNRRVENIELHITRDQSKTFVHVEEIQTRDDASPAISKKDKRDTYPTVSRLGYGLVATTEDLVYLFLRNYEMEVDIVYSEIDTRLIQPRTKGFSMMRAGSAATKEVRPDDLLIDALNIFTFTDKELGERKRPITKEATAQSWSELTPEVMRYSQERQLAWWEGLFGWNFGATIRNGAIVPTADDWKVLSRVDVNMQDRYGMTPLHHAAAVSARAIVRWLVKSGQCNYLIQDKWGRYAADLACEWGNDPAITRLLTYKQTKMAYTLGVPACPTPSPPAKPKTRKNP